MARGVPHPPEKRRRALALLREKRPHGEIAAALGVSVPVISAWASKDGQRRYLTKQQRDEAVALCAAGRPVAEVAARFGVTRDTVARWKQPGPRPPGRFVKIEPATAALLAAAAARARLRRNVLADLLLAAVLTPDARGRDMVAQLLDEEA